MTRSPIQSRKQGYTKIASAMSRILNGRIPQGCHQLNAFMCQLTALLPMFEGSDYTDATNTLDAANDIWY